MKIAAAQTTVSVIALFKDASLLVQILILMLFVVSMI